MILRRRHATLRSVAGLEVAVFGTGCFWGTEKGFWRIPGVYSTAVGYIAGHTKNPTYKQVCSGQTGHNEVVQVVYDPKKTAFADLLALFWVSTIATHSEELPNC